MTVVYFEEDGDTSVLYGRTIGVIGYGPIARAVALNLRDSGASLLVCPFGAEEQQRAEYDTVTAADAAVAVQKADVLLMLTPDETMPQIYIESVSPYLRRGHTLLFASAYNVTFGYIEPPPFVDVGLVAPRGSGSDVRRGYVSGEGVLSFVAVGQDASRKAWDVVLAVARAAGLLRAGAVEVLMEQEAELNLFVQQTLIPVFHNLMTTAAALLMRSGYPAEAALPDLYIAGRFNSYLREVASQGLLNAVEESSKIEQYAALSRLSRFSELKLERLMELTLEEIQSGQFAQEWSREHADGCPRLKKLLTTQRSFDIWDWEQQTLDLLDQEGS
jgi:ketol-acid reductoisomerase